MTGAARRAIAKATKRSPGKGFDCTTCIPRDFCPAPLIRILQIMSRLEEVIELVERQLEEMLEESTRLRAALEALGGGGARAGRGAPTGGTARRVVATVGSRGRARPRSGSAVAIAHAGAAVGADATQEAAVERAVRQLRQELAAGLRG